MKYHGLKVGDRGVYCNRYAATVTRLCEWSDQLIEIRVPGGGTCIDASEFQQVIGKFARSIESGWLGVVVAVEEQDREALLKMKGVNTLCHIVAGGDISEWIDEDDVQWFVPEDVRFVAFKEDSDASATR